MLRHERLIFPVRMQAKSGAPWSISPIAGKACGLKYALGLSGIGPALQEETREI